MGKSVDLPNHEDFPLQSNLQIRLQAHLAKCYRAKTEDEASLSGLLAEAAACDRLARKIEK
jgi:hypothetical protein